MIKSFSYETNIAGQKFYYKVYAVDKLASVRKWIEMINDFLGTKFYSFNEVITLTISELYYAGQLGINLLKEPYSINFKIDETIHTVTIVEDEIWPIDFIANITFLSTEEGGRLANVRSGYRGQVRFYGKNVTTSSDQTYVDKDKVFPRETASAEIRILAKELFENYLFEGQTFEVLEGSRLVGHGKINEIINEVLKKPATNIA